MSSGFISYKSLTSQPKSKKILAPGLRKNLLYIEPSNWWPDNLDNLFNSGWVYHFNAVPGNPLKRDASYWIKRAFTELYEEN